MFWTGCQALALGVARKRSELKSASVVFSLLSVVGLFLILITPLLVVQDQVSHAGCQASVWLLCFGFSLCYGSLFAKLFRLYCIFTSRKLVVPRLSNKKLLMGVAVFLAIDFVLVLIYSIVTPAEPFAFSSKLLSSEDLVTGYREFNLQMCSFHLDSPVLSVIFVYKALIILGGGIMAFFIRQVDRRFSATTALGWDFFNMLLTIVIAFAFEFETYSALEASLFIPVFCGLWIVFVTLCALTLDSNVLLACRDFSKPLRSMLKPNSKDSKDRTVSTSGEKDLENSGKVNSHSSTIFVVNREMFPSKYEDFDGALLEQILVELKFQVAAVRRALTPVSGTATTVVEVVEIGERRRNSTKGDAGRMSSKNKFGLAPPSSDSRGSFNSEPSPKNISALMPEPLAQRSSTESTSDNPPQNVPVTLPEPVVSDVLVPVED
jgi:hypothetical protein